MCGPTAEDNNKENYNTLQQGGTNHHMGHSCQLPLTLLILVGQDSHNVHEVEESLSEVVGLFIHMNVAPFCFLEAVDHVFYSPPNSTPSPYIPSSICSIIECR